MVSAAPFRDRVVHHALCAVIEPIFERGFIFDSYANRKGKGTHRGGRPLREVPRPLWPRASLRHPPLLSGDRPRDSQSRSPSPDRLPAHFGLLDAIVDGSNPQEPVYRDYPGDDLSTPLSDGGDCQSAT